MPSSSEITTFVLRYLMDARKRRLRRISEKIRKGKFVALNPCMSPDDVLDKKFGLAEFLADSMPRKSEQLYSVPGTPGADQEAARELEKEVQQMEELKEQMTMELKRIEDDMALMRKKKDRIERMERAYLEAMKRRERGDYSEEYAALKRIFHEAKDDLSLIVDLLFPENQEMKETFAELTSTFAKGGDDMYIDVTTEMMPYVYFLVECHIAQFHRNDKSKIKFVDML